MRGKIKRKRFAFYGIVQGVGFRPYVYRIAHQHGLGGFIRNTPEGVIVEVEGPEEILMDFPRMILSKLPPAADVTGFEGQDIEVTGEMSFSIVDSDREGQKEVIISPDIALCDECLRELSDPRNRRYHYPFINCTNCGPRLTIIRDVPYDRPNTSMSCFNFCPACLSEYANPLDRRFHAEPNACPVCGPKLWLVDGEGRKVKEFDEDPIVGAVEKIRQGLCVAIKGLGGFHLAVDATSEEAVKRLRLRKWREEKPFAIMVRDLEMAKELAEIDVEEQNILLSPRRPIVLCKKKQGISIAPSVAPGLGELGIMLPYTPLHHLILERAGFPLVMTSGNQVDEPICLGNREAIKRLKNIADYFLLHNRDILVRCDDSVEAMVDKRHVLIRRSRGWAPRPIVLKDHFPAVLALGGHSKAILCVLKKDRAYLSPHIGDLETPQARDFFMENVRIMERISGCTPDFIACDLHPAYWTTTLAKELPQEGIIQVQHHHAHIASAMAEKGLSGPVIGLAMDGTGYGDDGTVWGGEFLLANLTGYERIGHLFTFPLPGAEMAAREPWRSAAGVLYMCFGREWQRVAEKLALIDFLSNLEIVHNMMERHFNAPSTSSLGRLFDAVAAIVGIRRKKVSFEGQAAMELQALVKEGVSKRYPYELIEAEGKKILDQRPLVRALVEDVTKGEDPALIVSIFHFTIIEALAAMTKMLAEITATKTVVLSGGCFQNRVILAGTTRLLQANGLEVCVNEQVPLNDGGISLGQAVVAGSIIKGSKEQR